MNTTPTTAHNTTPAKIFVRNFNIMLKFSRLYGFDHARTGEQIEKTWAELQAVLSGESEGDILLAASGNQLLLNGAPLGNTGADRSFAQLLTSIGLSSIHFSSDITREDFDKFVRGFPAGGKDAATLAESYKSSMEGVSGIRLNEICFVPSDSSVSPELAAQITRGLLGTAGADDSNWFNDPEKLLQLIAAAEGSRGSGAEGGSGTGEGGGSSEQGGSGGEGTVASGTGNFSGGTGVGIAGGTGKGTGTGAGSGTGPGTGFGSGSGGGAGIGAPGPGGNWGSGGSGGRRARGGPGDFWAEVKASMRGLTVGSGPLVTPEQEDVCKILRLLRQLTKGDDETQGVLEPGAFQSRLSTVSIGARVRFNDALVALASQTPQQPHDKMFLVRLAEHMAIRFAVDTYEKGDSQVTVVQQMLERMGQEIAGLREILSGHESKLKDAGIVVESHGEQLERQFWTAVPEATRRSVLLSADAWCVPPKHILDFVRQLQKVNDHEGCRKILSSYLGGVANEKDDARRKTFSGLCDLAECYGDMEQLLGDAINRVGARISVEEDRELRSLSSAAFVRLSQEGATRRSYSALLLVLSSLEKLETQAPALIQGLQQRIGLEDRLSEFFEDAVRDRDVPVGLVEILKRLPRSGAKHLAKRFGQARFREDCDLLLHLFQNLGAEGIAYLKQSLVEAPPLEAVESVGLLSRVEPSVLQEALPRRLRECPRSVHDTVVRRIAFGGAPERGQLLASLFDSLDPLIRPLAVDEMGMSGDKGVVPWLIKMAETEKGENELVQLKAIEAIGRLRPDNVVPILKKILEAKQVFRWMHPSEVRIVAAQTLAKIDGVAWHKLASKSDLTPSQLSFPALDIEADASGVRQRRYARLGLTHSLTAVTTNLRENFTLEVRSLNLGGGIAAVEQRCPAGTVLALRFSVGMRTVRAQVFVRENLTGTVAFEIVEISLADRSRLRQLLADVGCSTPPPGSAKNRVRRRRTPKTKS